MDTTKKGDKLEDQVFEVFESQIAEDCFFSKREFCKIFRKKGYYSKDREKNIIFDVSIEVTLPGQERYSLLFLIECKNYGHSVPVDDAEEFFTKIQQISGAGAKGIIVSTNSFQDGAFKFSRSKGIGLLRYFSKDRLEWVLTRSPSSMASSSIASSERSNSYQALHDESFGSRYFDFYGCVNDTYTVSSNQFFSSLARTDADPDFLKALAAVEQSTKESRLCVPYLEREEIESRAVAILSEIEYVSGAVSINSICDYLKVNSALVVKTNANLPCGVLGQIAFGPDIISIDNDQASTNERTRFTLAHELGHYLLEHGKFMARESCHEEDIAIDDFDAIDLKDLRRLEWQANYFASCLLLPKEQFEKEVFWQAQKYELSDRGFGLLYLDDQRCNIDAFHKVTAPLMQMFQVSRTVVKLRLIKLGFLNEGG
ncbi:ImmA/IrrE family metallo-endopeptidase [Methylomonas sp. TEB]|uniref:ImmA/IrrE family metallo-endopeptidase n=1 Tax=Methylomonas sp. TEB TaxID=3398229 RepID=UPI0039F45112